MRNNPQSRSYCLIRNIHVHPFDGSLPHLGVWHSDGYCITLAYFLQILEAGYSQREKLSVQQSLESAEVRHKEELSKLEKRLRDKLKAQVLLI